MRCRAVVRIGCLLACLLGSINPASATHFWYARAEGLYLSRAADFDMDLVFDEATMQTALTGEDIDFDHALGPRITIGARIPDLCNIEVGYFGTHDWIERQRLDGSLSISGDLAAATTDFQSAAGLENAYGSKLHNIELNAVKWCGDFAFIAGARYFELSEDYHINAFDGMNAFTSAYTVDTKSQLCGAQLGALYTMSYSKLIGTITGKAGLFAGDNVQRTLILDQNSTTVFRDVEMGSTSTAFIADVSLILKTRIMSNCYLVGGYNAIWIDRIALASDHLDFTNAATSSMFINDHGQVIYHGASLGLEFSW